MIMRTHSQTQSKPAIVPMLLCCRHRIGFVLTVPTQLANCAVMATRAAAGAGGGVGAGGDGGTACDASALAHSSGSSVATKTPMGRGLAGHGSQVAGSSSCGQATRSMSTWRSVRGVIFDMDGTLTLHGAIDFARMKSRLGLGPRDDVLTAIAAMADAEAERALAIVEEEERAGLQKVEVQPGLLEMLAFLCQKGVQRAILTRNAPFALDDFVERLQQLAESHPHEETRTAVAEAPHLFKPMLTRDFTPRKPHPAPIEAICKEWGVEPHEVVMVGDFKDDCLCGSAAGAGTVLLRNDTNKEFEALADHSIHNLLELTRLLDGVTVKHA